MMKDENSEWSSRFIPLYVAIIVVPTVFFILLNPYGGAKAERELAWDLMRDDQIRATIEAKEREQEREQRLFSDCMEDKKEYECEALLRR